MNIYKPDLFYYASLKFSSVQSLSRVRLFATPLTAASQASLSITNSQSLLKLMSIQSMMPSNNLVPFSSCLQFFPASGSFPMSVFCIRWPSTAVSVSASVLSMNEYSEVISFRTDWFDLLAVQETLKVLI